MAEPKDQSRVKQLDHRDLQRSTQKASTLQEKKVLLRHLAVAKESPEAFDLVIIGGGSAGFAAALKAHELQLKTLIVNAGLPLGGTCLNAGCVPTKRLLYTAELLSRAENLLLPGLELSVKEFDAAKALEGARELVAQWRERDCAILKDLDYVTYQAGWGVLSSKNTVRIGDQTVSARKIIIATGSKAFIPPVEHINHVGFITNAELFAMKRVPESMLIIGGGSVGLEFAQMFKRFGVRVTLLECSRTIFRRGDLQFAACLEEILKHEGIILGKGVVLKSARRDKDLKIITGSIDGKLCEWSGHEILVATGKTPTTRSLGLEKVGVRVSERGAIIVNAYMQTSEPDIFAVGDVTSAPVRIETTAAQEGRIAVENAFFSLGKSIDYHHVPYALYTDPELAFVGLREQDISNPAEYRFLFFRSILLRGQLLLIVWERLKWLFIKQPSRFVGFIFWGLMPRKLLARQLYWLPRKILLMMCLIIYRFTLRFLRRFSLWPANFMRMINSFIFSF